MHGCLSELRHHAALGATCIATGALDPDCWLLAAPLLMTVLQIPAATAGTGAAKEEVIARCALLCCRCATATLPGPKTACKY